MVAEDKSKRGSLCETRVTTRRVSIVTGVVYMVLARWSARSPGFEQSDGKDHFRSFLAAFSG
jgi:hypothetical protein